MRIAEPLFFSPAPRAQATRHAGCHFSDLAAQDSGKIIGDFSSVAAGRAAFGCGGSPQGFAVTMSGVAGVASFQAMGCCKKNENILSLMTYFCNQGMLIYTTLFDIFSLDSRGIGSRVTEPRG